MNGIHEKLVSFSRFQDIYCLTDQEREVLNLWGPMEVLDAVKGFIVHLCNESDYDCNIQVPFEPFSFPKPITIAYQTLPSS